MGPHLMAKKGWSQKKTRITIGRCGTWYILMKVGC